jgi:lactose/L-arabinose transport system permease protein
MTATAPPPLAPLRPQRRRPASASGRAHRTRERSLSAFVTTFIALGALVMLAPFFWLIISSTYPSSEIFTTPPHVLPGGALWENLTTLFGSSGFGDAVRNSLVVSTISTVLGVLICTSAGYAFAKFTFRGSNVFFIIIIASLALPSQVTLVPLFQMMVQFGWLNTYPALILPNLAVPFGIFLMRQTMLSVPDELIQAARVDGAGEYRTFFQIVLPTVRPALAACSIFLFLGQWNDLPAGGAAHDRRLHDPGRAGVAAGRQLHRLRGAPDRNPGLHHAGAHPLPLPAASFRRGAAGGVGEAVSPSRR